MIRIVERRVGEIVLSFYNHGTSDFFDFLDDDVVWYGPMDGQIVEGKEKLMELFNSEKKTLKFNIENMHVKMIPLKVDSLIIVATYKLMAYYPSGKVVIYDQHLVVVLGRKKMADGSYRWRCPIIHVSDILHREKRDKLYLLNIDENEKTHFEELFYERRAVKKISFAGASGTNYFIAEDSIIFVEGAKGVKSYVYTPEGTLTVNHLIKDIESRLPDYYYRCHSSYIVNMKHITKISGYKIFLDTGHEIPVPVKKYAAVKEHVTAFMETQ